MGLLIPYFRSSGLGTKKFCEMQYYQVYVLGRQNSSLLKAEMGTAVHKVMEVLGQCKKILQDGEKQTFTDDALGEIKFTKKGLYTDKFVDQLIDRSYTHYRNKSDLDWDKKINNVKMDGENLTESKRFVVALSYKTLRDWDGQCDPRNKHIVEVEPHFDLPIEEDWALYEYEQDGQMLEGRLSIKGTIDTVTLADENTIEVQDYKGLPLDTKIPTVKGWSTMGQLKIGDIVFDIEGNQTTVINKSKVKNKTCYLIEFDDTTQVTCDDEHLWLIDTGEVKAITELQTKDNIAVCQPIITDEIDLPIDPYLLGVWLGDGRNRSCEITSGDQEVFSQIELNGFTLGKNTETRPNKNCQTRRIMGQTAVLRKMNVLHNKHIPPIYMRSSVSQRLELLRGLMDSDGSANHTRKQCIFSNCNKTLSNDVKELLLSLGQRVNQANVTSTINGKIVKSYPIHFKPVNIDPFHLTRKSNKIKNWGFGKSRKRQIRSITKLSEKIQTQCISVDSPTRTYLCTENFIPTHNTGQRKDFATGEEKDYEKLRKDPQLLLYNHALRRLYPDVATRIMTIIFIRDGGPYSMCFDEHDDALFLEMLRKQFEEAVSMTNPKPVSQSRNDWKCKYVCAFSKYDPKLGMSPCVHAEKTIRAKGIEQATKELIVPGFDAQYYSPPG